MHPSHQVLTISEAQHLRFIDLSGNLMYRSKKDYSQRTIDSLNLDDLFYLLLRRVHVEFTIKIVIDKIERNWEAIDVYYPDTEHTEWFENSLRELVLLPTRYWDIDPESFAKVASLVRKNVKRPLTLAPFILEHFNSYTPKPLEWTDADLGEFQWNFWRDIAGNYMLAINQVRELLTAIRNGVALHVKTNGRDLVVRDEAGLRHWVVNEFSEHEDLTELFEREKHLIYG